MLLKVGDLDPNLASSDESALRRSQHSTDGKEYSAHSITSAWLSRRQEGVVCLGSWFQGASFIIVGKAR